MTAVNAKSFAEKSFINLCAFAWRVIRLLDPYKIQRYFTAQVNDSSVTLTQVYNLGAEDAKEHICRVNNNRMKSGDNCLAKRGDLIKIINANTGEFTMRFVHGAGEHRIRHNDIGLDYDALKQLGILNEESVNLIVSKANAADREFYLMYLDKDVSSRHSRSLGWYILIGTAVAGMAGQIPGLLAEALHSIIKFI